MAAAPEQLELDAARSRTEALYREHGAAVFRICGAVLRDRAEAEDATQQVFLSAHRALLGGAVPREPLAWLATIARRECWTRSSASVPAAERDGMTASDAAADAIRNAEVAELWTAIAELPQPQRDALLLREIRGLSYAQLAEELSLSAPATRSLLARARQRLRLRLRGVQAALGGASWIETLARLFAGGGNPAAPVVRAAAVGLGVAAISSGAALEHQARRPVFHAAARPAHAAARVAHPVVRAHPVRRPRSVEVAPSRAPSATTSTGRHASASRGPGPARVRSESGDDHGSNSGSDETTTRRTLVFPTSGHEGEGDGGGGGSGESSHGGDGGHDGESGHGGSSDGSGGGDGDH